MSWRALMNMENERLRTNTQYAQKPQKGGHGGAFDTIGDIGYRNEKVKNMDDSEVRYQFKERNEHFKTYEQKEQKGCQEGSFATIATIADKSGNVKSMIEDVAEREYRIEERAAIMEFDGGLSREEAERLARDVLRLWEGC